MLCEASLYTVYMQPLANIMYVSVQKYLYCTPTEPDSESMNTCAVVILYCRPAQSVSEIRTLSGCVLYEGYRVSSVLVDNDTVLATGEEEGNGDSFTHSLYGKITQLILDINIIYIFFYFRPAHTAVSPYALPCFGCNPLVSIVLTVSMNIWSS